jgi:hypothetical protein
MIDKIGRATTKDNYYANGRKEKIRIFSSW